MFKNKSLTRKAVAHVAGYAISAGSTIPAWKGGAVIFVSFALFARKAHRAEALKAVDEIAANATVEAWVWHAFVNVHLTVDAPVTCTTRKV